VKYLASQIAGRIEILKGWMLIRRLERKMPIEITV
jgi:hypothetical protein